MTNDKLKTGSSLGWIILAFVAIYLMCTSCTSIPHKSFTPEVYQVDSCGNIVEFKPLR